MKAKQITFAFATLATLNFQLAISTEVRRCRVRRTHNAGLKKDFEFPLRQRIIPLIAIENSQHEPQKTET